MFVSFLFSFTFSPLSPYLNATPNGYIYNKGLNSVYPPELYTKNHVSPCTFNLISNTPILFNFITLVLPSVKINGLTVKWWRGMSSQHWCWRGMPSQHWCWRGIPSHHFLFFIFFFLKEKSNDIFLDGDFFLLNPIWWRKV